MKKIAMNLSKVGQIPKSRFFNDNIRTFLCTENCIPYREEFTDEVLGKFGTEMNKAEKRMHCKEDEVNYVIALLIAFKHM